MGRTVIQVSLIRCAMRCIAATRFPFHLATRNHRRQTLQSSPGGKGRDLVDVTYGWLHYGQIRVLNLNFSQEVKLLGFYCPHIIMCRTWTGDIYLTADCGTARVEVTWQEIEYGDKKEESWSEVEVCYHAEPFFCRWLGGRDWCQVSRCW